jgi:hypothetical protein
MREVLQSPEWDTSYQVIAAIERFASCEPAGIGVGEYFRAVWVRAAELVWVRCCDGREVIDGKGERDRRCSLWFLAVCWILLLKKGWIVEAYPTKFEAVGL